MALEPNSVQRDRMLSHGKTKLAHVQFLDSKDPTLINEYFRITRQVVLSEGGSREFQLIIDQTLAGGKHPYQFLTVDYFPSSQGLLLAHEKSREIRDAALQDIYGIYLKQSSIINKVVKRGRIIAPTLVRWLGTGQINDDQDRFGEHNPETDPDPEAVRDFSRRDLDQSFYMMNLNLFARQHDRWHLAGKAAYKRYSAWITPYLISVGGYPVIFDKPLGTYIGDQQSSLLNNWSEFGLVFYPSRNSFLRLMTNAPHRAAAFRRAGLQKAILMPCILDMSL